MPPIWTQIGNLPGIMGPTGPQGPRGSPGTQGPAGTSSGRIPVGANMTFYVSTTGNDNNSGTSGSPWLTIQHALSYVCGNLDFGSSGATVTIQLANGTYSGSVSIAQPLVGSGTVVLQGNASTAGAVVLSAGVAVSFQASLTLQYLDIGNSGGVGLAVQNGAVCRIGAGIRFTAANQHVYADSFGNVAVVGNYSIIGNAGYYHMQAGFLGYITGNGLTVTVASNLTFTDGFIASSGGQIALTGMTYSGASGITGPRYSCFFNGVIYTGSGGSATYFPGSTSGSTSFGGQYD